MDEAAKDQPQVRRLGRPPKVRESEVVEPIVEAAKPIPEPAAQALANRIWVGQSPDAVPRGERIERIRQALEAQGLSMEGVKL
jgi:hypothetical protein